MNIKRLLIMIAGAAAGAFLKKRMDAQAKEKDLWAEATDKVQPS